MKLGQAELVVIDEAAAIPLPFVKNLLGPYLVFLSSTINGYEGTGRSLSLKLIQQLRDQSSTKNGICSFFPLPPGRVLKEVELKEPIRYTTRAYTYQIHAYRHYRHIEEAALYLSNTSPDGERFQSIHWTYQI